MKLVDGWWCPQLLSGPGKYRARTADLEFLLEQVQRRGVCIQAGGHIGTWPIFLAQHFEFVFTFEPDSENHAALVANVEAQLVSNVLDAQAALGKARGRSGLYRSPKSTGQHRLRSGGGHQVMVNAIDDLAVDRVDAIVLDVEGSEIDALLGGVATIMRDRPVIQCEENKRCREHGHEIGDLEALLASWGYRLAKRINEDLVFLPI